MLMPFGAILAISDISLRVFVVLFEEKHSILFFLLTLEILVLPPVFISIQTTAVMILSNTVTFLLMELNLFLSLMFSLHTGFYKMLPCFSYAPCVQGLFDF